MTDRVAQSKFGEAAKEHGKKCGFYFNYNEKLFECFKQESDKFGFMLSKWIVLAVVQRMDRWRRMARMEKKKKVWLAVFALVHLEGGPEDVGWGISGGDGED